MLIRPFVDTIACVAQPLVGRSEALFSRHRSAAVPELWPWQREVLVQYEALSGDTAIELPTGTGKTLVGLLVGEDFRARNNRPVAYLAGNKQLAQQVERQARELTFPIVRFQGPKEGWASRDVRAFNFGEAIGVMNYWNYFNAAPGIESAGMLILDDVHLLEGPLRDIFTVTIARPDPLCDDLLRCIVARCPYYSLAVDLLGGVDPPQPPEMLVFPDSAELADQARDLLDARLENGTDAWWAWQQIRSRLEVCCWLVSRRGITLTPYLPPSQTISHFVEPSRRLYLSATVGSVDDLQRRLGTPPLTKLTASVQPRQGDRFVVLRDETDVLSSAELVEAIRPLLQRQPKALWLCARRDTAAALEFALTFCGLPGRVRQLQGDNGADEPFAAEPTGHLVTAGRYDGMDFPDEACRVEVVPEVPVATSDLEEFVTAYLRDAPFAEARFSQRVAQALGRCNRSETDRAVYLLTDPEFVSRFSRRRTIEALPDDVRADVVAALERSDRAFSVALDDAARFLAGEDSSPLPRTALSPVATEAPSTAGEEVSGFLALWREDYGKAAELFDSVAARLAHAREHRAFWLAMRALALLLAARYGDVPAATEARAALRAAATAGAASTFFTRLRLAEARISGTAVMAPATGHDQLFTAWDGLIDRLGAQGPRFDRWCKKLLEELGSDDHDVVARAIARVGAELLGHPAVAPQPTAGQEDARWELQSPRRTLAFEVKLAPEAKRIVNDDVEQAEGAVRALGGADGHMVRGLIVTPYPNADATAIARLDRVRLIERAFLVEEAERVLSGLREYRRGWTLDADARGTRRDAVEAGLPPIDWLFVASQEGEAWVGRETLENARSGS